MMDGGLRLELPPKYADDESFILGLGVGSILAGLVTSIYTKSLPMTVPMRIETVDLVWPIAEMLDLQVKIEEDDEEMMHATFSHPGDEDE